MLMCKAIISPLKNFIHEEIKNICIFFYFTDNSGHLPFSFVFASPVAGDLVQGYKIGQAIYLGGWPGCRLCFPSTRPGNTKPFNKWLYHSHLWLCTTHIGTLHLPSITQSYLSLFLFIGNEMSSCYNVVLMNI